MSEPKKMPNRRMNFSPREKINPNTIKRLLKLIFKGYKIHYIIVILCIIISSITGVIGQLFLGRLIDNYITPLMLENNPVFDGLLRALLIMAGIYLFGIICNYISQRIMIVVSQGTLKKIRCDMFHHMQTLPISYFDENPYGDIMSRYTNDTDTLRQMISQSIPNSFASLITIVSSLVSMFILNIPLTLIFLLGVFIMMLSSKEIMKNASKYFVKQQESIGALDGYIEEMIDGVKVVKVFTHEKESNQEFDKLNKELCDNMTTANKYANTLMPVVHNIGNVIYVVIAILGGIIAINYGVLTLGAIASFLTLTRGIINPINQVTQQINSIIMALAGATRIFNLLDQKSEVDEGKVKLVNVSKVNDKLIETKNITNTWAWKYPDGKLVLLEGDVRLKDVTFGYEEDKIVLHGISLYAKPGQKIAFVGSTGAGKTTITNLINRFYDVKEGTITYDGIDIKDIEKESLRKSIGIVLQDINLFTGTIKENIKYGKLDATDEEVISAARIANADSFIRMLPNGYDTEITGNGANLSQGQRQLLAIARALIANPPVMILDEATSSIDTRTEKLVQSSMDKLMEGRTVFVIAHRLSTIRNSKAIMVLEHGKIIERGEHEYLLNQKGKYYELYTGKLELE